MKTKSSNTKIACFLSLTLAISLSIVSMPAFAGLSIHQGTVHRTGTTEESPLSTSPNTPYRGNYPLGMVSDGWNPTTGQPVYYNTTSFLGTINITSLYASNYSNILNVNDVTFQLNEVLSFTSGGVTYSYWIQDVAELDTVTHGIYFFDNIWNFSSSNGYMSDSSVTGNGSVSDFWGFFTGSYFYEDTASYFLPGNHVDLSYPATIQLKVVSTISDTGYPGVIFQYNDGYGWVTYDNAYFFSNNISSDSGFVVSGYTYTDYGLPYNAGIIIGGYGNGAGTNLQFGNLTLGLQYWNGHNYQAPSFASDYGADTAEGIYGASIGLSSENGVPVAKLSAGQDNPGMLYSPNQMATLNVTSPYPQGMIGLEKQDAAENTHSNGNYIRFTGGGLNENLLAGSYQISEFPYAYTNITLNGGGEQKLVYQIFYEYGLPSNSNWSLSIFEASDPGNNFAYNLNESSYAALIEPGDWAYSITGPWFYEPSPATSYNFQPSITPINFVFEKVGYLIGEVTPSNASIMVNGTLVSLSNGKFNLSLTPGTYNVTADAQGYGSYHQNVTVYFRSNDYLNITMNILHPKSNPSVNNDKDWIAISATLGSALGVAVLVLAIRRRRN